MEDSIQINVIGGSASTAFALPDEKLAWPNLLEQSLEGIFIRHRNRGGMTLSQSIELINETPKADILIMHFGTSVAWPSPLVRVGVLLGLGDETAFHQAPYRYTGSLAKRFRKNVKAKFRNFIKYLLFIFGAYKPRTPVREIDDQVRAVLSVALRNAPNVIWMQHSALQSRKLWIERRVYVRYYMKLVKSINSNKPDAVRLVLLDDEFISQENYLLDGIHLTELGHRRIAEKLKKILSESY